jgi:hypothetical protein
VTFAEHPHHPLIQVDVVNGHADAFGAAHAGINQQQDDGGVTPAGEVPTLTALEEADELLCPDDTDGLLGKVGRLHAVHGAGLEVSLGDRPLEEGVETPVAVVGGRRLPTSELVGDEVLDVLAAELAGEERMTVGLAVAGEEPDGVGVGLDGPGALVLGLQGAPEARLRARRCPRGNGPRRLRAGRPAWFLTLGCRGAAG